MHSCAFSGILMTQSSTAQVTLGTITVTGSSYGGLSGFGGGFTLSGGGVPFAEYPILVALGEMMNKLRDVRCNNTNQSDVTSLSGSDERLIAAQAAFNAVVAKEGIINRWLGTPFPNNQFQVVYADGGKESYRVIKGISWTLDPRPIDGSYKPGDGKAKPAVCGYT